jgi:hypothetical protein
VVVDAFHCNRSPGLKFPANREINRELSNFGPFPGILGLNRPANSDGYNKIPYATEQGIILMEQGTCLGEQGIQQEAAGKQD